MEKILKTIINNYKKRKSKNKELFSPLQYLAISLIGMAGIFLVFFWLFYEKPIYKQNAENFRYSLEAAYENKTLINDLDSITDFKWDTLYSFAPYTSAEYIIKKIGNPHVDFEDSISEESNQLVFCYRGRVVCYINGHPDYYGVYLRLGNYPTNTFMVRAKDKPVFTLSKNDSGNFILTYVYPKGQPAREFLP